MILFRRGAWSNRLRHITRDLTALLLVIKKRGNEPLIETLRECQDLVGTGRTPSAFCGRVRELLEVVETLEYALGKIAQLERNAVIPRIPKLLG